VDKMPSVNHNIGYIRNIIETARRAGELTTPTSIPSPYDQFTDYNDLTSGADEDSPNSQEVFHWGFHSWGDENNLVGP